MIEKILVNCHDNPGVPFTAVAQGHVIQSKYKSGIGVYSIKSFISKTRVKIAWIQKNLIFKLAIN